MKKIIFLLFFVGLTTCMFSQRYDNAVGVRAGYGTGVTYKHNFDAFMFESIAAGRANYFYLGALVELYRPLNMGNIPGKFHIFYGGGIHMEVDTGLFGGSDFDAGIDGICGIEYEFNDLPFSASVDVKPELNFIDGVWPGFGGGVSARYEF